MGMGSSDRCGGGCRGGCDVAGVGRATDAFVAGGVWARSTTGQRRLLATSGRPKQSSRRGVSGASISTFVRCPLRRDSAMRGSGRRAGAVRGLAAGSDRGRRRSRECGHGGSRAIRSMISTSGQADVSVDHPAVVENYRQAHEISLRSARGEATTEDLRQAMQNYRSLFEELLSDAAADAPLARDSDSDAYADQPAQSESGRVASNWTGGAVDDRGEGTDDRRHRRAERARAPQGTTSGGLRRPRPRDGSTSTEGAATEPLFSSSDAERYRDQWTGVQTEFVDRPREAVEQADRLVADLMQSLAAQFSETRVGLESQWNDSDDVSTEDLRVAMTRYRSFFERLLSA